MAAKLLAPRWFARAIKGGSKENVLCQVDANCHRLAHGLLLSPFGSSRCIASISWRIDAVEGRGRRPSHRAPARPRGAAPLCHTNTHIELILDVPRNDVPGGVVHGSDIAATAPCEGRAPARPRGAAPLCHTNTHIELILDASESRTSIDPDIMARSTLSPSSVPQQGVR